MAPRVQLLTPWLGLSGRHDSWSATQRLWGKVQELRFPPVPAVISPPAVTTSTFKYKLLLEAKFKRTTQNLKSWRSSEVFSSPMPGWQRHGSRLMSVSLFGFHVILLIKGPFLITGTVKDGYRQDGALSPEMPWLAPQRWWPAKPYNYP